MADAAALLYHASHDGGRDSRGVAGGGNLREIEGKRREGEARV